jgi:hypothetical protein
MGKGNVEILISEDDSSTRSFNQYGESLTTSLSQKIKENNLQFGKKESHMHTSKMIKSIISKGKNQVIEEEVKEDEEGDLVLNFGQFN